MGDLQCPARVFLVAAGRAEHWVERLRSERIGAVYAPTSGAQPAAAVAAQLQASATVVGAAAPAHEPSSAVVLAREALADIADRHRGEAVLLVDEAGFFTAALRGLVPGLDAAPTAGGVLALETDADGWRRVAMP